MSIARFLKCATAAALALGLAACVSSPALQPFASDGCSMFPDHSPIGKADWCGCCVAHDLAYWRGGSADERLKADLELKRCVKDSAGSPVLAEAMLAGVRTGGAPHFLTSYRWGYGWAYGRFYKPLSEAEETQAASLRARYMADNPVLACTTQPERHPRVEAAH